MSRLMLASTVLVVLSTPLVSKAHMIFPYEDPPFYLWLEEISILRLLLFSLFFWVTLLEGVDLFLSFLRSKRRRVRAGKNLVVAFFTAASTASLLGVLIEWEGRITEFFHRGDEYTLSLFVILFIAFHVILYSSYTWAGRLVFLFINAGFVMSVGWFAEHLNMPSIFYVVFALIAVALSLLAWGVEKRLSRKSG